MNRLSSHFPLIIAALLALATFWLEQVVRNESHGGEGNARHDPDLIVNHVAIERFDVDGKRVSHVTANSLLHYPDDDTADLTAPVITLSRDIRPTIFSSQTAHANNDTKVIVMQGNVRGERTALPDLPAQTIATEELTILTDDEIARTDKPVTMTRGAARLTGIGAEWNNLTGLLTVQNQVRVTLPSTPGSSQY